MTLKVLKAEYNHWLNSNKILIILGLLVGAAVQINWIAALPSGQKIHPVILSMQVLVGAVVVAGSFLLLSSLVRWFLVHSNLPLIAQERFCRYDRWTYLPFLFVFLGSLGLRMTWHIMLMILLLFVAANLLLVHFIKYKTHGEALASKDWLTVLFLLSGMAALMYQIIWQRILFTLYGVNIESVTIIVSIFMFGLGIGSIVGGFLSRRFPTKLPQLFFLAEILIGLFGLLSLPLIRYVGQKTQHLTIWGISLTTFSLLLIPTLLMGATLPILVAYFHRKYRHVGQSVGILYFFNTLGSALACFLTVDLLFVLFGLPFTTIVAASFNFIVGYLVFRHIRQEPESGISEDGENGKKHSEEFVNAENLLEEGA